MKNLPHGAPRQFWIALACALAPLGLSAQTTLTYSNGQTRSAATSTNAPHDPTTLQTNFSAGSATQSGVISGSGSVEFAGPGQLILSAANTYTGGTTISGGTLQIGAGGTTGSLSTSSAIVDNSALTFNRGNAVTQGTDFSGAAITGTGSLTQSGSATLTLNAANTYTGGTFVDAGILALAGGDNRLSTTGNIAVAGGTLDLGANNQTTSGSVSISTGNLTGTGVLTATSFAATTQNPYDVASISAVLGGTGGFTRSGGGTLILTGANTYTGTTTNSNGVLQIGNGGTTGSLSTSSALVNNSNLIFNRSDAVTQGTDFSGAAITGAGNLIKDGAGTLTLTAANAYSGVTAVRAGTLVLSGGGNRLSTASGLVVSGGTLDLGAHDQTSAYLELSSGRLSSTGGSSTLIATGQVQDSNYNYDLLNGTVDANVTLGAGSLGVGRVGMAGGTVHLDGTSAASTVTIEGSTLVLGASDRLAATAELSLAASHFSSLDLGTSNQTLNTVTVSGGSIAGTTGVLTAASFSFNNFYIDVAVSGRLGGAGALTKTSTGTLTFTNANTYTGGTTIDGGTVQIGDGGTTGSLSTSGAIVDNGSLTFNRSNNVTQGIDFSSAGISGTGSLTKIGAGTLTLNAANTYTGDTVIHDGTLMLAGGADRLGTTGNIEIKFTGSTLDLGGTSQTTSGYLQVLGGGIASTGGVGTLTAATYDLSGSTIGTNVALGAGTVNVYVGTTTLNGTFAAGTVNIDNGTLILGASDRLADNAALILADTSLSYASTTLDLGTSSDTVGTVTLFSANITGTTGVLSASSFTAANNGNASVTAILGGAGALTQTGTGTLTLSGANTYTGGTNVNAGTLVLSGGANRLSTAGDITIGGGMLDLATNDQTTSGHLLLSSGGITGTTGVLTASSFTATNAGAATISAILGGDGALTKTGAGMLTLSGANTYTGGTDVNAGTLALSGGANRLSTGGNISIGGGTLDLVQTDQTTSGNFSLTAGSLVSTGGAAAFTAANYNLSGGTIASGIALGTGTVNVSGDFTLNSTSAASTVNLDSGTFTLGASNRLADTAALNLHGGTLALGANSETVATVDLYSGSITGTTGVLTAPDNFTAWNDSAATISAILGGAGGLYKEGDGTLTLTRANTYTGGTQVDSGTLLLSGGANRLGTVGNILVAGGILDLGNNNQTTSGDLYLNSHGTLSSTGGTATLTAAKYMLGSGTVEANVALGAGTVNVNGNAVTLNGTSAAGTVNIGGGTLTLGASNRLGNGAAVNVTSGTLALGANSDTVGAVTISGGSITGTTGVLTGSSYAGTDTGSVSAILGGSGGLTKTGGGTLTLTGANTYTGNTHVNAGSLEIGNGGTTGSLSTSSAIITNASLSFNRSNAVTQGVDFSGGAITGTGGLAKNGSGTLSLNAANTYTGGTTVYSGTLQLSGGANRLSTTGNIAVRTSGTLDLGANNQTTSGTVSITQGSITSTTGVLTASSYAATNSGAASISAILGGTGGLTKTGSGSLNLTGANTYTGATTIDAGRLGLNGSLASDITVNAGGTLGGNGSTSGNLLVAAGGTLAPGNSIGTLAIGGNATFATNGSFAVELGHAGPANIAGVDNDFLNVSGSLSLPSGNFNLDLIGYGPGNSLPNFDTALDYNWTIVTAGLGITGFNNTTFTFDFSGLSTAYAGLWSVNQFGNSLLLSYAGAAFTPVPEPATYAGLGVLVCGLLAWHRRRQRLLLLRTTALVPPVLA